MGWKVDRLAVNGPLQKKSAQTDPSAEKSSKIGFCPPFQGGTDFAGVKSSISQLTYGHWTFPDDIPKKKPGYVVGR